MNRFRFDLATAADDADLRAVLRETPMQGRIAVAFQREPSWFAAAVLDGEQRQVIACRDLQAGRVVGFGCRSLRRLYVDGAPQCLGYLSSLRLLPELRSRGLVARGYRFFRELHEDGQTPYYLTTIAEGNMPALRTLVGGRAGLPYYLPAGRFFTLALPIRRTRLPALPPHVVLRRAVAEDLPHIVSFLREAGPQRQFFPVVAESDFGARGERFNGLLASDFHIVERAGEILGVLGAWDQHALKQTVVVRYHGALAWLRPVLNATAALRRQPLLPQPGESFRFHLAALPVVQNAAREVCDALLAYTVRGLCQSASTHLLIGLHERDPLLPVVRRWSVACYTTHLYVVGWDAEVAAKAAAHVRVPYLELGTL